MPFGEWTRLRGVNETILEGIIVLLVGREK
jgi:hypothetical protein